MAVTAYWDLEAWKEAMSLAEDCYVITATMQREERFGLVAQIRAAAVSIPSNIAEGHNRRSDGALLHHLSIALGSQAELETQVRLALRLRLMSIADANRLLEEAARVGRLLSGLARYVWRCRGETTARDPRGQRRASSKER